MDTYKLARKIREIQDEHGDVAVKVRHLSKHEFGPDDMLDVESVAYDPVNRIVVITVEN